MRRSVSIQTIAGPYCRNTSTMTSVLISIIAVAPALFRLLTEVAGKGHIVLDVVAVGPDAY